MVVVEGAEAFVALDVEPHPLRHLLYGQVAEPLEGQSVEHGLVSFCVYSLVLT